MDTITVNKVDTGINRKLPPDQVVWQDGRNVRFRNGRVEKMKGKTLLNTLPYPDRIEAIWHIKEVSGTQKLIVGCNHRLFVKDSGPTGAAVGNPYALAGNSVAPWSFIYTGGLPIISNGVDYPLKYDPSSGLAVLSGAPKFYTGVNHNNRVLIGNYIDSDGIHWPGSMMYSNIANPEDVGWTIDKRSFAGNTKPLIDPFTGLKAADTILRIINVGPQSYVFTDKNIWIASDHPDPDIVYSVNRKYPGFQIVAPRAVTVPNLVESDFTCYFMTKKGDFYSLGPDGLQMLPDDLKNREGILPELNDDTAPYWFAFRKYKLNEVHFCNYAENVSFIWDIERKHWTIADCNFTAAVMFDDTTPYDMAGDASGRLFKMDDSLNDNGAPIDAWVQSGSQCAKKPNNIKYVDKVRPYIPDDAEGNMLYISVGTKKRLLDSCVWQQKAFKIGTSTKCDYRKRDYWYEVMFRTAQLNSPWSISGYETDVLIGGPK